MRRWKKKPAEGTLDSETTPLAVLHIIHGKGEHSLRYERLAEKLVSAGIEVWVPDQRGRGKTADLEINDAGSGGLAGHCADKDCFNLISSDVHEINQEIKKIYNDVPIFLLGHSSGSFTAQNYIQEYSQKSIINGCILSGISGPGGFKTRFLTFIMPFLTLLFGARTRPRVVRNKMAGTYNKYFKPNRTNFDWLNRDETQVDSYINDPVRVRYCSFSFYRDFSRGLQKIHRQKEIAKININLPIYIISGSVDAVGFMGIGPTRVVDDYRSHGIKDLEFVLYPGARHEILNETNRDEVIGNLVSWMERHLGKQISDNLTNAD